MQGVKGSNPLQSTMFKFLKSIFKSIGHGIYHDSEVQKLLDRFPRTFHFVKKRFTPDEEFGLRLTIGAIFVVIFIFLFYRIVDSFFDHTALVQSDLRIINLVQIFRSPLLNNLMLFFTYLGKWEIVFAGVAILSILFLLTKRWRYLLALIVSVSGGEFFVWLVKNIIDRPRPSLINALAPEKGYSFPSGHSFVALSFYGLLAYFLFRAVKSKLVKIFIVIISSCLILAIGLSRIYLGVHWPTDVLASYAAGAAWLSVLITAMEIRRKFKNHRLRTPFFIKSKIVIIAIGLVLIWSGYIGYYFIAHPLKAQTIASEKKIIIQKSDLPNNLFSNLPKTSEDITGGPMEPINIIIIGSQEKLAETFTAVGWYASDPITLKFVWRSFKASIFNQPYPEAPGIPSFWHALPNDLSYAKPTANNSVRERHHLHLWLTAFLVDNRPVWFGTSHYDKKIKIRTSILPVHTIDPAIDKERDNIKNDLLATGQVKSVEQFQIVEPTLGSNSVGDQFFTDGKADIIFLKK